MPEPQAQQEAEQQAASQGPSKAKQQKTAEQKKFLQSTASDPRLVKLQKKIGKAKDVKSVSVR